MNAEILNSKTTKFPNYTQFLSRKNIAKDMKDDELLKEIFEIATTPQYMYDMCMLADKDVPPILAIQDPLQKLYDKYGLIRIIDRDSIKIIDEGQLGVYNQRVGKMISFIMEQYGYYSCQETTTISSRTNKLIQRGTKFFEQPEGTVYDICLNKKRGKPAFSFLLNFQVIHQN